MKKLIYAVVVVLALATAAIAGNAHRDGTGALLDFFTPGKTRSVTHTKADVRYTPTAGTKIIRVNADGAIFAKLSSAQNKRDSVGFPIAANTTDTIGLGTRSGTGVGVAKIIFTGASSATKTIYIQEQ